MRTSLVAYDTSVVNMKRQHNRLLEIMPSESRFDLGRNGIISVSQSENSNSANASFVDFRNPSLAQFEDGLRRNVFHYDYGLDSWMNELNAETRRAVSTSLELRQLK